MADFLQYLLPTALSALVGVFSFCLYYRVRRTGFLVIGISFLIGMIPNLVNLAYGGPYLVETLLSRGWDVREVSMLLSILSILQMSVTVVSAVLVLVGLVLLSRNSHANSRP
jgi:hypothetical protein